MEMDIDQAVAGADAELDLDIAPVYDYVRLRGEWVKFLSRCLSSRLDADTFESYIPLLYARYPLNSATIADVFLRPQPTNSESLDPRIPRYVQVLFHHKLVDTPSILKALYQYSTSHTQAQKAGNAVPHNSADVASLRWESSYASEEVIFYRLTKAVGQGTGLKNTNDALETCKLMAKWMALFTSASAAFAQDVMGQLQSPQSRDEMEAARAAFVMLLLSICESQTVLSALSRPVARDARRALSKSLASFVPSILQSASQIASRLELFRTETLASFEPANKKKETGNPGIDDLLESTMALDNFSVTELPTVNSRAGLYIYLNAALVGRPLIDDATLFNYLHNRYQGDVQSTAIDLILASFDVLANNVFRNENQQGGHLLRSYLINKLPLLLAQLEPSMFPSLTPQYCITEALSQVDTNAFPTLSAMFDDTNNNNTFTDSVRQDFCFACCLHGLIPESSIEGLLGEITYQTLPQAGRCVKEHLVEGCMGDPEKIQRLIGELDNMDGNVGAVCQALAEVIGRLCNNKETMTLKLLCSQLAKKPLSLDVMLLFDKPITMLQPLCELLDNWRFEEDQGEYQPVYEEFGAVLLLVLAFVHRYNLSPLDLGIRTPDSFVGKLLSSGQLSKPFEDLTEKEKGHLNRWIHGLFDTESSGLTDELLSQCSPQDFYLLVPTLFYNIVLAFSTNYLDEESLKTGVEYLVNTFLLPSLVPALIYMSNHLWTELNQGHEQRAIIRILQLILLTKQGSSEAQAMLSAVVNIIAIPLEYSLRSYQRLDPKSQSIEPLLKAMKDNIRLSRRTGGAANNELEMWTGTANGGLAAAIRSTFQGFVSWSVDPALNTMPTSYTHRQVLAALQILGAKRLLHLILEEVKAHTENERGSVAHDVATALICAPDVSNLPPPAELAMLVDPNHPIMPPQRRLSLRAVLKSEAEDCKMLQKSDLAMAEIVVRLHRKVEAQLLIPPPADQMLQGGLTLGLDGNAAGLGDALAAAQNDGLVVDDGNMNLDLGGGSGNEMGLGSGADSNGGLDFGTDDGMFGGLGTGGSSADLLEGWDLT
ncbi:Med5-domain-containing protein [Durotheca rogersii]|uniref:Med5-domain-containing protein n=1 Tax=Durotheca rogersii TaxID=419775 RepID=UPI00221F95A6|nr:Med5-domain-containing protein [Durotheca rogersii]KAI5859468.1 Med5-domain-containing protein [Durotheca rogersii]